MASIALNEGPQPKKLFGRAFYESIGSPKFILAPMVDQSEFAWRVLTRSFLQSDSSNSILAYTPMLHARMFADKAKFRDHHFEPLKTTVPSPPDAHHKAQFLPEDHYLDGNPSCDRPLFVQFCANSPDDLLEAAEYVQPFCDAVDLNLGCPQGIAKRGHYGAFLQEDWNLVHDLINKLYRQLSVPVTAKIRILETKERTLEYAKLILSAGASILTVHGRQRDQKGHNTGLADWSVIRYLRDQLPPETVLFANGNILQHGDLEECLAVTGADGVMSAEGNLYDPSIFAVPPPVGQEGREYWTGKEGKSGYRMDAVFRRYLDIIHKYVLQQPAPVRKPLFLFSDLAKDESSWIEDQSPDEDGGAQEPPRKKIKNEKSQKSISPNLVGMQAHLFHLLRPLVAKHHHVRDALAKCRAGDIAAFENVLRLVEEVTKGALIEYEKNANTCAEKIEDRISVVQTNESNTSDTGSLRTVARCRRPWWICQPYVRPLPIEALQKGAMTLSKKEKAKLEQDKEPSINPPFPPRPMPEEECQNPEAGTDGELPREGIVCG